MINLIGALFLGPPVGPFEVIDELVDEAHKRTPVIVVDMHAEATSEKVALAKWLDGKVTAVFGTHTHIQTNDARVQPGGTAAITDAGMTGPHDSVIGVQAELAIRRCAPACLFASRRRRATSGSRASSSSAARTAARRVARPCASQCSERSADSVCGKQASHRVYHRYSPRTGRSTSSLSTRAVEMSDYRPGLPENASSFSRLILFDKRGMGLSGHVRAGTPLGERIICARSSTRRLRKCSTLMGVSGRWPDVLLRGDRIGPGVLHASEVKERTGDWPWGEATREEFEEWMDMEGVIARWGKSLSALRPFRA